MMLPRLQLLRELLREDGSIWVTIDDNEGHYLKVLMDEVFGRGNFVANVVWRSSDNSNNDAKSFSVDHNQLLVYSREPGWLSNKLDAEEKAQSLQEPGQRSARPLVRWESSELAQSRGKTSNTPSWRRTET
jgi:adenine-specific DNA-methyltransferase